MKTLLELINKMQQKELQKEEVCLLFNTIMSGELYNRAFTPQLIRWSIKACNKLLASHGYDTTVKAFSTSKTGLKLMVNAPMFNKSYNIELEG